MSSTGSAEAVAVRRSWLNCASVLAVVCGAALSGCHSPHDGPNPTIEFTRIPQADPGGRNKNDIIEGVVKHVRAGQLVVLYAKSGRWWVQPLLSHPFTRVRGDTKWTNATHLGTEYAALLVEPGYRPPPAMDVLPAPGGDVAAVAAVRGQERPPSTIINFGGYEWRVRDAPSTRGGWNRYDSSNVWTDVKGAMHLRIARVSENWTCAEVSLTRSLGYGSYRFVVRDTSHLEPSVVFDLFTWDYASGDQANREMDVEISHWGDPHTQNAQYVVQPYYVATNVARFIVPPGTLSHSFRWEQGRVSFQTVRGSGSGTQARAIAGHVFTNGVPSPGIESVRASLYLYGGAKAALQHGAEVVIETFEYLP